MTLIERIIQKYESSSVDWKGESSGNRSFPIQQKELDDMGKSAILSEAMQLEAEGLIRVKWFNNKSDLERISYNLEAMPEFYKRAGRIPKSERLKAQKDKISKILSTLSAPWIRSYFEKMISDLDKGNVPKVLSSGQEELYFKCFSGLDGLNSPVYKRIFSKQYLQNSKTFENYLQSVVVAAARRYHPQVEDDMNESQVLAQIYVEDYAQELAVKGNLKLEINGKAADLSCFPYGTVLNSETLKHAKIMDRQQIKKVITVENKANYVSMPYEEGTLIIFSHGYFSPKEREFLSALYEVLKNDDTRYYHTGDLDYGGVMIFKYIRTGIFPELQPLFMDEMTFYAYLDCGEAMEESKLEKLKRVEEPRLQPLIEAICKEKLVIEQESFLFRQENFCKNRTSVCKNGEAVI